ncbi:MAG: hypothetical protein RPV21_04945 [Candidatus Sedimenticola sp. (ex Thyasira tokunagai)]
MLDWNSVKDQWGVQSNRQIAHRLNCTPETVALYRQRNGLPIGPPDEEKKETKDVDWDSVKGKWEVMSDRKIASSLNCTASTVRKYRRVNHLPRKKVVKETKYNWDSVKDEWGVLTMRIPAKMNTYSGRT